MTYIRKYIFLFTAVCLLMLGAALLPPSVSAFAEQEEDAEEEPSAVATVDGAPQSDLESALSAWTQGTTLTLLADAETSTVTVSEEKTLDLNGRTFSLKEGETGSVLIVAGTGVLTVQDSGTGGKITGGNAVEGGGILIRAEGTLRLLGGSVTGNRASEHGGGVCASGAVYLSGDCVIAGNSDETGAESNLFLSLGNRVHVSNFSGRVGIKMPNPEENLSGKFIDAEGELTGEFFSDDKEYVMDGTDLRVAPLASVVVTYEGTEKIFPTTSPSSLKDSVRVEGTNSNGAPYRREIVVEFPAAGIFHVGECEVTVTAYGKEDVMSEPVTGSFTVDVVAPKLESIEIAVPSYPPVYFDTPIEELQITVTGRYEDGNSRTLGDSPQKTAEKNSSEPFITDWYIISGNLSKREEGNATLTVTVGQHSKTFSVAVSRYLLNAADFAVNDVTVTDRGGEWEISPEQFVPDLPAGIEAVPTIGGEPFAGNELGPGVYTVEISFLVEDVENYEVSGDRTATLTVNRAQFDVVNDAQEIVCSFTAKGGVPPLWKFTVKEIYDVRHPALEGDFEILQAEALTLLREDETELGKIGVRLLLGERAREREDLKLYRVRGDGSLEEVAFTRDGDYIEFEGNEFLDTQYVIAVDSGFGLYLALSIAFGALCVVAAIGFFCFLVFKRKVRFKQ